MGAIAACRVAGRRVPDEIALVAFDDPVFGALVDPPLTALRRSDYELGREAASPATGGLARPVHTPRVRVAVELVVRRSCGCTGHD